MKTQSLIACLVTLSATLASVGYTSENPPPPTFVSFQSRGGDSFERVEEVFGRTNCRSIALTVNGSNVKISVQRRGERFRTQVPLEPGLNEVIARCANESIAANSDSVRFDQRLTVGPVAGDPQTGLTDAPPSWMKGAVVYAPVPELWGHGGADAVRRKLPYLKRLGVNVLWLWPPVSRRARGEEYAVTDYFGVDESWGSPQELRALIDHAHDLGMRVIVDFVPNHMSRRSPYFRDAATHGLASAYWSLFDRDQDGRVTYYFDWAHLPNLNFDNAEVRNMIIEATKYWVETMQVDGFRMDVAWGIRRRYPAFWPQLNQAIKEVDPDVMLLAEASARAPYFLNNGFDVAYDWTRELGHWAWEKAFETPARTGALLRRAIAANAGNDGAVLRFINNNDTGTRFIDRYGRELTKVAAVLQFTVPGVPAMFAGDEIGASFVPYTETDPIAWSDPYGLRPFYKRLIKIRRESPVLTSNRIDLLDTNDPATLAYVRDAAGTSPVLVVLNFGETREIVISGHAILRLSKETTNLLTGEPVTLTQSGRSITVPVKARSSLVLSLPRTGTTR